MSNKEVKVLKGEILEPPFVLAYYRKIYQHVLINSYFICINDTALTESLCISHALLSEQATNCS